MRTALYDNKGQRATRMGYNRTKIEWIKRKRRKNAKKNVRHNSEVHI